MRKLWMLLSILVLVAMLAVGCGGEKTGADGLEPDKQEQGTDDKKND